MNAYRQKQINEKYSNTLVQIWHYYILSQFLDINDIPDCYYELIEQTKEQNESINPLILMSFIEEGEGKNGEIFKYILEQYKNSLSNDKEWKNSIMLSKWWLPLLKIKYVDGKNYHKFYDSGGFISIWNDLTKK